ncbi:Glycoside hydrolase superfamily [Penicillium macrosclerotiorum]|uniref:Glycoside hydrolase superfamily n=1 Tax=Penicillium macrosclerotiorum TaxID=303699 RepID=UPI002547CE73|nr:Glycoside hydrolase superfamily [Penicillium macrosclerotiorum]KAJ5675663.1 Glycoside hydrolase superfamily [Penicillium macrosclerotiorum]
MKRKVFYQLLGLIASVNTVPGVVDALNDTPTPVRLNVSSNGGNKSSPLLYGIMFEEMDHSGDGGIHGQLLQNNGFQGTSLGLTAYAPVGDVEISQDSTEPVSDAIQSSLKINVSANPTGYVGFANTGYNGVPVMNVTYNTSFWMKGNYLGIINIQLVGSHSGTVYSDHNLTVESTASKFTQFKTTFNSTTSPDGENEWHLTFDGSQVAGGSLNFGYIELFPPTYRGRENGLREDVAGLLESANFSFLRFPGGNNIEGLEIDSRWKWNTTIGSLTSRPGRESDWFYPNTDALGLDEYLWWCQDMKMTPLLAVWAGKSYGGIVSGPDLVPYVDDIMDELEYLLGDSKTHFGKLREQNGRKQPWKIDYVEIGNEDDLTGGCETYPDRFNQIYKAIHDKYPDITLVASNGDLNCLPSPLPEGVIIDLHLYRQPDDFVALFNQFDNQPRNQSVMIGEYGCRNTSDAKGTYWSYIKGSCSEAVYMMGMERNSDIVQMAAYAPMLEHFGFISWSPTLYGFDSSPGSITPSTSYFIQKMFASNKGDTVLPVNSSTDFGPLYWVASKTGSTYYLKLANYGQDEQSVIVSVPGTKEGKVEMLAGPQHEGNQPFNITITPTTTKMHSRNGTYTLKMEPWAVAVLVAT